MLKHRILKERPFISTPVGSLIDLEVEHPLTNKIKTYTITSHPNWVNLVVETEDKRIILVEQWRAGIDDFTLEVPGGKIDTNESPLDAALRELEEETGYTKTDKSKTLSLGWVWANPAIQTNKMYFYFINHVEKVKDVNFDEMELIRTRLISRSDVTEMLNDGRISHAYSVLALYKTFKG